MKNSFQLVILAKDLADLRLGYKYFQALPKLQAALSGERLFTIGADDIETYAWGTQGITLTSEATKRLLDALGREREARESVLALNRMKDRLGWGNALEFGLYNKAFVALLDEEVLYGGIFLDAVSQQPIHYPVIRAGLTVDGKARFYVLPIHLVFLAYDPIGEEADAAVTREAAGDWRALSEGFKQSLVLNHVTGATATAFRKLIRDTPVRAIMEDAGKLR